MYFSFYEGFFIKDYAKNNRTAFKVEETPYFLDQDMVIGVGNDIKMVVECVKPLPKRPT